MKVPKEGEVYKHFKGGIYVILHEAFSTEDESPQVVYKSIDSALVWVRPTSDFSATMTPCGRKRFTLIP
jgi:hypothetical protein